MLLSGLDKNESELKERGKSILYALKIYKNEIEPELFEDLKFKEFVLDPLGKEKKKDQSTIEKTRLLHFDMTVRLRKIKAQGPLVGVDTNLLEKQILGEDDDAIREVLQEMKDEKKGHQFKAVQKFDIEHLKLQVIDE